MMAYVLLLSVLYQLVLQLLLLKMLPTLYCLFELYLGLSLVPHVTKGLYESDHWWRNLVLVEMKYFLLSWQMPKYGYLRNCGYSRKNGYFRKIIKMKQMVMNDLTL